jgi:hypothetical protein
VTALAVCITEPGCGSSVNNNLYIQWRKQHVTIQEPEKKSAETHQSPQFKIAES